MKLHVEDPIFHGSFAINRFTPTPILTSDDAILQKARQEISPEIIYLEKEFYYTVTYSFVHFKIIDYVFVRGYTLSYNSFLNFLINHSITHPPSLQDKVDMADFYQYYSTSTVQLRQGVWNELHILTRKYQYYMPCFSRVII